MSQRIELYRLVTAVGSTGGDHAFAHYTGRAVVATVIARATMIQIGFCVVVNAVTVDASKTSATDAVKSISTGVAACTAIGIIRSKVDAGILTITFGQFFIGTPTGAVGANFPLCTGMAACTAMIIVRL